METQVFRLTKDMYVPIQSDQKTEFPDLDFRLILLLQEEFGIQPVAARVRLVSRLDEAIDMLALRIWEFDEPDPLVIAWQRDREDDPVDRVIRYAEWAQEFTSQFIRVYEDKLSPGVLDEDYSDYIAQTCVFTDIESYFGSLLDERVRTHEIETLFWHSAGNELILVDKFDRRRTESVIREQLEILASEIAHDMLDQGLNNIKPPTVSFPITTTESPWTADPRHRFLEQLHQRSLASTHLHRTVEGSQYSLRRRIGPSGIYFGYHVAKYRCRAELWIPTGAQDVYSHLRRYRSLVQQQSGLSLIWGSHGGINGYRITRQFINGGSAAPEHEWPRIQDNLIDTMIRLELVLRPYIESLYDDELRRDLEIR